MPGPLHWIDWVIVLAYVLFALWVGVRFARRAGQSTDEFFLSGRTLPWWVAGTSMVATSFAADTPLAITGMVRDFGIWKNWLWWCFAANMVLQVFLFARWWRRGGVVTKAELVELRYGGPGATALRGTMGVLYACVTNTVVMCWVLLAAAKICGVLFEVDKVTGLFIGCVIALTYSLMAGFWGVVVTDLVQFVMAMTGAIVLAFLVWQDAGASDGILAAVTDGRILAERLRFLPEPGPGGFLDASFWTVPVAATAVYLGVSWWAVEQVDGAGAAVQRVAAARNERDGLLATLWFTVAHTALRPWCWILVALGSLLVIPQIEVAAPAAGEVVEATETTIRLTGGESIDLVEAAAAADWAPAPVVGVGQSVAAGEIVAETDSERAYVVMLVRYLPVGLLGLVAASLLAAFMSTMDTHTNLASSFFVNDVYQRFLVRDAGPKHYVRVARIASVGVMALAGVLAWQATSILDLFLFFFALLSGVGPIYVLRWLWWRVRASTEITAMIASVTATTVLTSMNGGEFEWSLGPLSPEGSLAPEGRLILVVLFSAACALVSLALTKAPDPATLTDFYRRVRPQGFWGPVAALCPDVEVRSEVLPAVVGWIGGMALTFGLTLALGFYFVERNAALAVSALVTLAGTAGVVWALKRIRT